MRVGVLGATGLAGQQVLAALERHPWFTVAAVGASDNSAGKSLAEALHDQRRSRGWRGFIAPIPNCTTTGLAVSLKPLHDAFGVRTVMMTSLQAVSGAGRQGGVLALDVIDNVIPFIPGEEEKVERETKKILAHWGEPAPIPLPCPCTRA